MSSGASVAVPLAERVWLQASMAIVLFTAAYAVTWLFSATLSATAFRLACVAIVVAYGAIVKRRVGATPLTLSLGSFQRFVALDEAPFVVLGLIGALLAAPSLCYIVPCAVYAFCQLVPRLANGPALPSVGGLTPAKLAAFKDDLERKQPLLAQSMAQLEVTAFPLLLLQSALGSISLAEPLLYVKFYLAPRARKSAAVAAYVAQLSATIGGYADRVPLLGKAWAFLKTVGNRL